MPFWAYTAVAGVTAFCSLYLIVCLFKPVGFIKRRWVALFSLIGLMATGVILSNIPPLRPAGIAAEDWTQRTALCRELSEGLTDCLQQSLTQAPAEAVAALELRLQEKQSSAPATSETLPESEAASVQHASASPTDSDGDQSGATMAIADVTPTASVVSPPTPQTTWSYISDQDEMRDAPIHHACTTSTNVVRLGFPYGTQRTRLCVRQHPRWGQDVIVRLEGNGQILCSSYDGCTVRVRFDEGDVSGYSAAGPSDHSTDVIFIQNDERFLRSLKGSSRTIIEVEFYQAGTQALSFETTGLIWPRP